jgi:hypothetical protein
MDRFDLFSITRLPWVLFALAAANFETTKLCSLKARQRILVATSASAALLQGTEAPLGCGWPNQATGLRVVCDSLTSSPTWRDALCRSMRDFILINR